ncbi:MAG TPA: hypothetical protein VK583_04365 [Burkholderiales bacterium]|nr:hypothetical protein [Burkholderiales bacterium]
MRMKGSLHLVISGISLLLAACQVPSGGPQGAASALWSTYATRAPFHVEGGKGTQSKVLKFQLRPDPLAN